MNALRNMGRIELIIGPMFAGKSTELIRRVNRLRIRNLQPLLLKSSEDTRFSNTQIQTHDK